MEHGNQALDAGVGFAGSAKGDAKIAQAGMNLGQSSVVGCWSYQGSRPLHVDRFGTVTALLFPEEKVVFSPYSR